MTNEDHTEPPSDGPLTVHRLKQSSPEPCHPEYPLLVCSVHLESRGAARSRSHCQGPSSHPPGSGAPFLCTTGTSVGKLEQRSPTRVHSSFQGERGGGAPLFQ